MTDESMTVTKGYFAQMMGALKAGYPNFKAADSDWKATMRTYHAALGNYPREVLVSAVTRAQKTHPEWFPTLGQMREICEAAHRTWIGVQKTRGYIDSKHQLSDGLNPLADDNPFERLARIMETENSYYSDKGGVPREAAGKRAGQIMQLLEKFPPGSLAGKGRGVAQPGLPEELKDEVA